MNQYPPAHQLTVLSTRWGGISHPVAECTLPTVHFFSADLFLGGFFFFFAGCFFLKSDLTFTSYILPTCLHGPYLPIKNHAYGPLYGPYGYCTYHIINILTYLTTHSPSYLPNTYIAFRLIHEINANASIAHQHGEFGKFRCGYCNYAVQI